MQILVTTDDNEVASSCNIRNVWPLPCRDLVKEILDVSESPFMSLIVCKHLVMERMTRHRLHVAFATVLAVKVASGRFC